MMFFGIDKLVFEGLKRLFKEVDMILGELFSKFGSKKMLRLRKDTQLVKDRKGINMA